MRPGLPTTNRTSAMSSLLNIAALRSRTVGLEACQLGSRVLSGPIGLIHGLEGGDPGALAGCNIWRLSFWDTVCGGDKDKAPLLIVSAIT